jgi:hypothetical protein
MYMAKVGDVHGKMNNSIFYSQGEKVGDVHA